MNLENKKAARIKILYHETKLELWVEEIGYGCEEEGVPFYRVSKDDNQLNQGLEMVLIQVFPSHINFFLERNQTRYLIHKYSGKGGFFGKRELRMIGKNAGRYIKGKCLNLTGKDF